MHRNLAILIGFVSFLLIGLAGFLAWMLIPQQHDTIPEQQVISNNSPTVNLLGAPDLHTGVNVQFWLPNNSQNSVKVQDGNQTTESPEIDLYEDVDPTVLFRPQRNVRGSRRKRKQKRIALKRKRKQWRRNVQRKMASQTTKRPKCKRCRFTNETTEDPVQLVTFITGDSWEDTDWALDEGNSTMSEDHNFTAFEDNSTRREQNPTMPTVSQATEAVTETHSATGHLVTHASQEVQYENDE